MYEESRGQREQYMEKAAKGKGIVKSDGMLM